MNDRISPDLIIYGGTFDPPHDGHLLCVKLATARFPQAQLLICPTYAPLRDATTVPKNTLLTFDERLQLANAVFQGERVTVSDLEARLPRPSLTVNTLQLVQRKFHSQRLALLLGQDQFSSLRDWQGVQEIVTICDIIVARRRAATPLADSAAKLATTLATTLAWQEKQQCYSNGAFSVYTLVPELLNISSTAIREACRRGQQLHSVPAAVATFFANRG